MKALEFLIDKTGALIYPTSISKANTDGILSLPTGNVIILTFYNAIQTISGYIYPITPVVSGLSRNINIQARPNADSAWSNVTDGNLDISINNMCFPSGVIQSINPVCTSVMGCNYILVQMYRGA